MPSGLCSYMIGAWKKSRAGSPSSEAWRCRTRFTTGRCTNFRMVRCQSEFIQIERMDPVEHQNCWPTAFAALMVLSPLWHL